MKKLGTVMMIVGALMVGYWAFYEPRAVVTAEMLLSRKFSSLELPSIWFLIGGMFLGGIGLVIHSIDSDLR